MSNSSLPLTCMRICQRGPIFGIGSLMLWSGITSCVPAAANATDISGAAYELLLERTFENREAFFVYRNADSGFNHGFPACLFGAQNKIHFDAAHVDLSVAGTAPVNASEFLDRTRGTVFRLEFEPLSPGEFAGLSFVEPEDWCSKPQTGVGYDLNGANKLVLDVRSPTGASVQFGMGGCTTDFQFIPAGPDYMTFEFSLDSLSGTPGPCPPLLDDVRILFTVVTNDAHAPNGATLLLDNVRYEPVPPSQETDDRALSFPLANQTFGIVPVPGPVPGCNPIPLDQLLRNVTTIYESSLAANAFALRGRTTDLDGLRRIADTFRYALDNDNQGNPIPGAPDGSRGLHNAYESGDIALLNGQGSGAGQAGEVRLAGFTASAICPPTNFCLVLDGATGGNNAFVIHALLEAYLELGDPRHLDAARTIGLWIIGSLMDSSPLGYGGYFLGYPDEGVIPKELIPAKSVENNADIFAAFNSLAGFVDGGEVDFWFHHAQHAGDFVMRMYEPGEGRFYAGTVPPGTLPSPGIEPDGTLQQGDDVINTFDFLDASTFTTLAMAGSDQYRDRIDWRRPVVHALQNFQVTVSTSPGVEFRGFNIVPHALCGAEGIAWEFTAQMVVTMDLVDQLNGTDHFAAEIAFFLGEIERAQSLAPFADGRGLVASTLKRGDDLAPIDQCLMTPFQCIPERVGLAATTWAIFAEAGHNPLGQVLP